MFGSIFGEIMGKLDVKGVITSIFGDKAKGKELEAEIEMAEKQLKERMQSAALEAERIYAEREKARIDFQKSANDIAGDVITTEIIKGTNYVKNARPTVIYIGAFVLLMEAFGIRLILMKHFGVDAEIINSSTASIEVMMGHWRFYGSVYGVSRTVEKVTGEGLLGTVKKILQK